MEGLVWFGSMLAGIPGRSSPRLTLGEEGNDSNGTILSSSEENTSIGYTASNDIVMDSLPLSQELALFSILSHSHTEDPARSITLDYGNRKGRVRRADDVHDETITGGTASEEKRGLR